MLSSKELMERTGVSRATLNNYIGMGLIPKPVVKQPDAGKSKARRIGCFPSNTVNKLERIKALKKQGVRMEDIALKLGGQVKTVNDNPPPNPERRADEKSNKAPSPASSVEITPRGLRLTIENLEHPAYLLNNKFEVEWSNAAAEAEIFGKPNGMPKDISDRNVFSLLFGGMGRQCVDRATLFSFHLEIAKNRMSKANLLTMDPNLDEAQIEELADLYTNVEAVNSRQLRDTVINLGNHFGNDNRYRLYASFFREGVFFAYTPAETEEDSLLQILSRRDLVIRDLLRNRKPYVTPLAVLVADLQNSVKICAELPPDEYFELINQIWRRMEPIFRKYYATHGKHVGDGIVYYFFPQPDCSYVLNAIECAWEMTIAMQEIDREWQARKNWANSLKLNIGLDEGQEWFGAYQTTTHLELTVLGDTINQAARLSDFARDGAVWVTKSMLSSLSHRDRDQLEFGIKRRDTDGNQIVVASTYGWIANLVDLNEPGNLKLQDIAAIPVTEIIDFKPKEND